MNESMSSDTNINLYIVKKNKYGNPQLSEQYVKGSDIVSVDSLVEGDYWSIKHPSQNIINIINKKFPDNKCNLYTNHAGDIFMVSPLGSEFFHNDICGKGSGIVIEFVDEYGKEWYLLISDDKPYISHVQGSTIGNETFNECIKREVYEETHIDLRDMELVEIAEYGFVYRNALVDCEYTVKSVIFYVRLRWDYVKHLFPYALNRDEMNIISSNLIFNKNGIILDEVKYVIAVPVEKIFEIPQYIDRIKVKKHIKGKEKICSVEYPKLSHHRQFVELFKTNNPIVKPPYLDNIIFHKRYTEARLEFDMKNLRL